MATWISSWRRGSSNRSGPRDATSMIITSAKNPRIKQVIDLKDRRDREQTGLTRVVVDKNVVEGAKEPVRIYGNLQKTA